MASAMEDSSKQFIEFVATLNVPEVSNSYDITGCRAADVIAIFKSIVNDRLWKKSGKEFTFRIEGTTKIVFSVKPNLKSDHQPGNGVVLRENPVDRSSMISKSYNAVLVKELNEQYSNDTKKFAQDIKRVFNNNLELFNCGNEIIKDVYILLLFEIGRRLVKDGKNSTAKGKALDNLPISGAITKIVKLFENEDCSFKDFFSFEGKFHCFTGTPSERKKKIGILTLVSKVNYEDIKQLFYGEEATKQSPEDTASKGNESSKEDAKVSDLSEKLKNLDASESSQKKVGETVEEG